MKTVRLDMKDRLVLDPPDSDQRDISYELACAEDGCALDAGWKIVQ